MVCLMTGLFWGCNLLAHSVVCISNIVWLSSVHILTAILCYSFDLMHFRFILSVFSFIVNAYVYVTLFLTLEQNFMRILVIFVTGTLLLLCCSNVAHGTSVKEKGSFMNQWSQFACSLLNAHHGITGKFHMQLPQISTGTAAAINFC